MGPVAAAAGVGTLVAVPGGSGRSPFVEAPVEEGNHIGLAEGTVEVVAALLAAAVAVGTSAVLEAGMA